jgi:HlyD family secretion protein
LNNREFVAMVESGEANVAKLEASIRQAEADLEKCRRDLERQERLSSQNATSQIELADYRTAMIRAQAGVDMRKQELLDAQAMLRRAKESLEKTIISSPIDGVVAKRHAKPGEVVITGTMNNPGTVIMVITDLSRMQVRARVDETDVPQVKQGQTVRIYLPSDPRKPIPGRVTQVAAKGSKPAGRDVVTFETLVLVESDDPSIKPAMTANVEIEVASKEKALTVPVQAVVQRKRKDVPEGLIKEYEAKYPLEGQRGPKAQYLKLLFTMDADKAVPHLVETGIADATRVEVVEGVPDDAQVITGPYRSLDQLKDGAIVKLEEKEKENAGQFAEKSKLAEAEKTSTTQPSESGGEVAKAP